MWSNGRLSLLAVLVPVVAPAAALAQADHL
jgi:hypothetical protein